MSQFGLSGAAVTEARPPETIDMALGEAMVIAAVGSSHCVHNMAKTSRLLLYKSRRSSKKR